MEEETTYEPIGSRFPTRLFIFFILFLLLVGFLVLWFSRTGIADNFVRAELDNLGVEASYEIEDIGFNKQVIRNLVIGNPARPDLTAELVEVGNSFDLEGAGINWVRAKGVRLYGRLADGKISFGELDKFTDPEDDSPLSLPAISAIIEDTQIRIDSKYGIIGFSINGEGNLHHSFKGELAAISRRLDFGDCVLADPTYFGTISIAKKRPSLKGPLRLPAIECKNQQLNAEDMAAQIAVTLGEDFASWSGDIGLIGGPLKYTAYSAQEIKSSLRFSGDMKQISGDIDLTSSGLSSPYGGANIGRMSGPFEFGYGSEVVTARFEGKPSLSSARLSDRLLQQVSQVARSAGSTPFEPLAVKLALAAKNAGRSFDLSSALRFQTGASGTSLSIDTLTANARSGALLSLSDPMLIAFTGSNIRMLADGNIRMQGGGFPTAKLVLNDGSLSRGFSGRLEMAEYRAGTARLKVPRLNFVPARGGGTNIDGQILLTGPLPDGQITGLQVPVNATLGRKGSFTLFRQCVDLRFASLRMASFTAGPTQTRLCPQGSAGIVSSNGGGLNVAANAPTLNLSGALGRTPLSISSGALRFSMARGLNARDVIVKLGAGDSQSHINMALLTAAFGSNITGTISGANGKIVNVPLLMEEVNGDWRYVNGVFLADAAMRVRDEQQVERFRPLVSKDVELKFANGEITATGNLLEPTTETAVATVDIVHRLSNSSGRALLDVDGLTFGKKLQPEQLTPLTLGVIANVDGTITGNGIINWDSSDDGIKSGGIFRTDSMNLAAAFGPVTGLSGEIEFSDLLSLETKPGQLVRIAEVNPGVAVFNGSLSYRLLPDYKMEITGGKWPFAGGMLFLEPTILDLGEDASRRLEFTVKGIDAAQFLSQFEFENLAATGVFDGKLPMVFDQDGGRIVGGYLVARAGGGSLAYVGELTYEDMGTFANFAFNALKSLKYRNLTIGMDGDIAGEIITEVKFSGLQQGDGASNNFITKQLARIPLEFNVRIQAPFMQLMSSAKSYYEPEILVGQNLPALLRAQEARTLEAAKEIKEVSD